MQALRNFLNNTNRKKTVSISYILEQVTKILTLFILVQYLDLNSMLLMIVSIIAVIINILYLVNKHKLIPIKTKYFNQHKRAREIIKFCLPISVNSAINWFQIQGYRVVIVPYGYTDVIGLFSTLCGIGGSGMNVIGSVINQIQISNIYSSKGEYTENYLKKLSVSIVVILIITIIFGKKLVELITTQEIANYWWVILFGILLEYGNLFLNAIIIKLSIKDNTKRINNFSLFGFLVFCIGIFLIIYIDLINLFTLGIVLITSQFVAVIIAFIELKK